MLGVGDWKSLQSACHALVMRPRLVASLLDRITDFYCVCLERVLSKVPVDYASFYEPIASNTAPVISPAMFARFAIPGYRKVIDLLKRYRVQLCILCTTGGQLDVTSAVSHRCRHQWLASGSATSAVRAHGIPGARLRRQFGPDIALIGGIDASALSRDGASIRQTVAGTVPGLLASGRYLPCLDDRPRNNVPLAHYRLYRNLLEEIARQR